MGGRGGYSGSFYYETKRREKQLQARISELDSEIAEIDKAANKYADDELNDYVRESSNDSWFQRKSLAEQQQSYEWAREEAFSEYFDLHPQISRKRGELVTERKKRKSELSHLKSGQRSLL